MILLLGIEIPKFLFFLYSRVFNSSVFFFVVSWRFLEMFLLFTLKMYNTVLYVNGPSEKAKITIFLFIFIGAQRYINTDIWPNNNQKKNLCFNVHKMPSLCHHSLTQNYVNKNLIAKGIKYFSIQPRNYVNNCEFCSTRSCTN